MKGSGLPGGGQANAGGNMMQGSPQGQVGGMKGGQSGGQQIMQPNQNMLPGGINQGYNQQAQGSYTGLAGTAQTQGFQGMGQGFQGMRGPVSTGSSQANPGNPALASGGAQSAAAGTAVGNGNYMTNSGHMQRF
jgi:hypothetical protein